MDVKCYITACEVLDIATSIVNTRKYGIDCDPAILCDFTQFYFSSLTDGSDTDETEFDRDDIDDEGTDIITGTVTYSAEFQSYACVILKSGIIPTTTTTTTTTSTTTTTQDPGCILDFDVDGEIFITTSTTTATTSSTTSTTTTTILKSTCNVQGEITEITW